MLRTGSIFILMFALLGLGPQAQATNVKNLKYGVSFSIDEEREYATKVLNTALVLAYQTAPADLKIGPIRLFAEHQGPVDFLIQVLDSRSETAAHTLKLHPMQAEFERIETTDPEMRSQTLILSPYMRGPFMVRLFWDRLRYRKLPSGRLIKRADHDVKALVTSALIHEIHGNVRQFTNEVEWLESLRSLSPVESKRILAAERIRFESIALYAAKIGLINAVAQLRGENYRFLREALENEIHENNVTLSTWKTTDSLFGRLGVGRPRRGEGSLTCESLFQQHMGWVLGQ